MPPQTEPALPDPDLEAHLFGEVDPPAKPAIQIRVARERKEIQLGPDLARVVDESIDAISRDPRTFCRANELVTVIGAPPDQPRSIVKGTPIIRTLAAPTLLERLTLYARALKFTAKSERWDEVPMPERVVNMMQARGDWPNVRPLVGVVESPLFRPDGTIRQERGYDAATGYVYLPSADYPRIPDDPTQDDARKSLATLEDLFCDFPHVDRANKMVPIAAILTMLARAAIPGPVPAFLFDASTRGSGKTLQADVAHYVAFGRSAARRSYPDDDDELEKILSACALSGARCVFLDNVTRAFGGGPIDRVITARDDVAFRILGSLVDKRLPWHAVIMVSGNNLVMGDDTTRRVLVARLESPLENPEHRTGFKHVLPDDALRLRPRLVAAALTVLRAYVAKGRPDAGCQVWGSFEAWSSLIPGAIVYAGGADPMGARPQGDAALTDDTMALAVVLRELPRLDPEGEGLTAKNILAALFPTDRHPDDNAPDGWEDLRDAIDGWAATRPGAARSPHALGRRLKVHAGRVLGGRRLRARSVDGRRRWYSQTV